MQEWDPTEDFHSYSIPGTTTKLSLLPLIEILSFFSELLVYIDPPRCLYMWLQIKLFDAVTINIGEKRWFGYSITFACMCNT